MIKVVYFCYLVNHWKLIVSEQLERLKVSGLYDEADEIFVVVNLPIHNNGVTEKEEFLELTKVYPKLQIEFFPNTHSGEYPGIVKVREIGLKDECKVLYFHTKGVCNIWKIYGQPETSEVKYRNTTSWRKCLEYFVIDKWRECIEKLEEFDNVGVTCVNGWYWGNFFWTQTKHLNKTSVVNSGEARWAYEAWLNQGLSDVKNYEWYKIPYDPFLTYTHPEWYIGNSKWKGDKIILHKAVYGAPDFEIDEGYAGSTLNVLADVTESVRDGLKSTDYKKLSLYISNENLGGDPIFGTKKSLLIDISPESDPTNIITIGAREGMVINFEF